MAIWTGQTFLRRLFDDRQALFAAIGKRLDQEALVALLNDFQFGWLLRHGYAPSNTYNHRFHLKKA